MPPQNVNYALNLYYKIYCKDVSVLDIYVGRTTNYNLRKSQHKLSALKNNQLQGFLYQSINNNGGWDNWIMEKIEDYPCDNSVDACKREQYWLIIYKQLSILLLNLIQLIYINVIGILNKERKLLKEELRLNKLLYIKKNL